MSHSRAAQSYGHEASIPSGWIEGCCWRRFRTSHVFWTHHEQKWLPWDGVDCLRGRALDGDTQQLCFTVRRASLGKGLLLTLSAVMRNRVGRMAECSLLPKEISKHSQWYTTR